MKTKITKKRLSKKTSKYLVQLLFIALIAIIGYFNLNDHSPSNNMEINLIKCIDGDTAEFTKIGKTRFLFIDTPESTTKKEAYGKQASAFTCSQLKKAQVITYEYDGNQKDRYERTLAWIFVDGELLQLKIAQAGYVKKYYDYGNYKYESLIRNNLNDQYHIFINKTKK
ncbi:MAG: thermonuclease family protein [Bacilli bacterium]|jgi:micrococcal nuclease|nr:thermonuclease family protein [Bacilli bacterium]